MTDKFQSPPEATTDTANERGTWWSDGSEAPRLSRKNVRKWTFKGLLGILGAFTVLFGGGYWVLSSTEVKDSYEARGGMIGYKQSNNALAAGCSPIYRFPEEFALSVSGSVPKEKADGSPNTISYRTLIPSFGEMWEDGVPDKHQKFWKRNEPNIPTAEQLVREMWDGALVVYYSKEVEAEQLTRLEAYIVSNPDDRVLIVPWDAALPDKRDVAFATWNTMQSCHLVAEYALADFREVAPASDGPGAGGAKPVVRTTKPPIVVEAQQPAPDVTSKQ